MRVIPLHENRKRGCNYCFHVGRIYGKADTRIACPFDECPYKVLDKYESYEEFMASEDSRILVEEFFKTVADCYTLASCSKKPAKNYCGNDFGNNL